MGRNLLAILGLVLLFLTTLTTSAATVTANLTVDDRFDLYVSTDDTQLGTYIGSAEDWSVASTFTFDLTPGVTNYIHVAGSDVYQVIAAFMGDFSVDDTSFAFANGAQTLLTDIAHWNISNTGFGQDYYTPDEVAINGDGPWGSFPEISSDAKWIWSNCGYDLLTTRYFSTPITPIPEPATMSLLILGGVAVLLKRFK